MARPSAMNFFEHQDQARKNTGRLVLLFSIAVAAIIVGVYLVIRILFFAGTEETEPFRLWDPLTFLGVAAAVLLVIGIASLIKTAQLRKGGSAVAAMLGGQMIPRDTTNAQQRRLLNIVDEMALASGIPVPQVFLLPGETGINAFAAGYSVNDAAVAVTQGALDTLNRDELQGVIAHEFSHILNGDMRLNIRLIGIIFGILVIGIIGRIVMRSWFYGGGTRPRRSSGKKDSGGAALAIIFTGLALMIIGYVGTLIGRLIQAAVSRQKEFLADASAVQFTRNPDGIGGALKKIGGYRERSYIKAPAASQASHLFFGECLKPNFLSGVFATHPPLDKRIERLLPGFEQEQQAVKSETRESAAPTAAAAFAGAVISGLAGSKNVQAKPEEVIASVGRVTQEHVSLGATLHQAIPEALHTAVATPDGAMRTIFALLLDADEAERRKQTDTLQRAISENEVALVLELFERMRSLPKTLRLPLVELALPALRQIKYEELSPFMNLIESLVMADGRITLHEFSLQYLLANSLLKSRGPTHVSYRSLAPIRSNLTDLLAALAIAGNPGSEPAANQAFIAGVRQVPGLADFKPLFEYREQIAFGNVARALERLSRAYPKVKEQCIAACAHTAFADRRVTIDEAELLRVVSLSLDCPLPPFLPEPTDE